MDVAVVRPMQTRLGRRTTNDYAKSADWAQAHPRTPRRGRAAPARRAGTRRPLAADRRGRGGARLDG